MVQMDNRIKLAAKPVSGMDIKEENGKTYVRLKAGRIRYREWIETSKEEAKAIENMVHAGKFGAGFILNDKQYRIIPSGVTASIIAGLILSLDGVNYMIRYFKDIVVLVIERSKILFDPKRNIMVVTADLVQYIPDKVKKMVSIVTI